MTGTESFREVGLSLASRLRGDTRGGSFSERAGQAEAMLHYIEREENRREALLGGKENLCLPERDKRQKPGLMRD